MAAKRKVEVELEFDSRGAVAAIRAADGSLLTFSRNAVETDNKVQKGFRGMGAGAVAFGTVAAQALTAVASRLADVAGSVISTGAQFEQQMARVGALTQATGAEFSELTQTARALGASTVFSANQVAEGMGFLAQAGFTTNEITAAMPGLLAAAAAGQIELGEASSITANVLNGFGIAAGESGRVADVLTKASISSNSTIQGLGETMKFVGPVAASLGLGFEEVAAASSIMANAGIDGSLAGTALRASLLALATPSATQKALMADLNFQLERADGSTKSLAEIVGDLERSTRGMTDAQRTATLGILVGNEAASGFTALIAAGSNNLKTFTQELNNAGGTAERVARQQMNTFNGVLEELGGAIDELKITLFSTFDDELRAVIQGAIEFLTEFRDEMAGLLRFVVVNGGVAFEAFQEIVKIVFSNFGQILYNVLSSIPQLVQINLQTAADSFKAFVEWIRSQFGNMKTLIAGVGDVLMGAFTLDREQFDKGLKGVQDAMVQGMVDTLELGGDLGDAFGAAFGAASDIWLKGVDTSQLESIIEKFINLREATEQAAGGGPAAPEDTQQADPLAIQAERLEAMKRIEKEWAENTEEIVDRRSKAFEAATESQRRNINAQIRNIEEEKAAREALTESYRQSIAQTIASDQISTESAAGAANDIIGNVKNVIKAKLGEAIAKMLASLPFPSNILLGGVAAAGINAIFDRLIPKFADGVTNFGGGLAIVGDDPRRGGSGELVSLPRGSDVRTASETRNILNNLSRLQDRAPVQSDAAINRQTEILTGALQGLGDRIADMRVELDLINLRDAQNRQGRQMRAIGNRAG